MLLKADFTWTHQRQTDFSGTNLRIATGHLEATFATRMHKPVEKCQEGHSVWKNNECQTCLIECKLLCKTQKAAHGSTF